MDRIVRSVRLSHDPADRVDIGIAGGNIVAIERGLDAAAETYDACRRLACGGLIETHIHLDKSRLIDRCPPEETRAICSPSTNNVLNPVTPYGDCSLIRIANRHANVLQIA